MQFNAKWLAFLDTSSDATKLNSKSKNMLEYGEVCEADSQFKFWKRIFGAYSQCIFTFFADATHPSSCAKFAL